MKELAGRLSALDPDASRTLDVIAYFDRLIDGRVGVDGLLRGAATLCGAVVGYIPATADIGRRVDPAGVRAADGLPADWPAAQVGDGAVWLERNGRMHVNDTMILERLAIALSISSMRLDTTTPTRRAVEILLAPDVTDDERYEAAERLMFGVKTPVFAIAVPPTFPVVGHAPQSIVATRFGIARAVLCLEELAPASWAGIGVEARSPVEIRESWRSALVALRLTTPQQPVVHASQLGALLDLAELADHRSASHPDVDTVTMLSQSGWNTEVLQAIADGASHRTIASIANVHHSTIPSRLQKLTDRLGFDPTSPGGRTRLYVALMVQRLASGRIPDPQ